MKMLRGYYFLLLVVLFNVLVNFCILAYAEPGIKIVGIEDGAIVTPGEEITIIVEPVDGFIMQKGGFGGSILVALDKYSFGYGRNPGKGFFSLPVTFTFKINQDAVGEGMISAMATSISNKFAAAVIKITCVPQAALQSLEIQDDISVDLDWNGNIEKESSVDNIATVYGIYSDGIKRFLGNVPGRTYISSDPAIISIDNKGKYQVYKVGQASITVSILGVSKVIPLVFKEPTGRRPSETIPPVTSADIQPSANSAGWNNSDIAITFTAQDNEGGSGIREIHYSFLGTEIQDKYAEADTTSTSFSIEGIRELVYSSVDKEGNYSETKRFNIKLDKTPPATPTVTDEGEYTASLNTLSASWISEDPESGIAEYQYALGTSQGGEDILKWASAGDKTSVILNNLALQKDITYYFSVKAKNIADLWSEAGYSDGIMVKANQAPVAQDISVPTDEDIAAAINISAVDADSDSLAYTVLTQPASGTLSGSAPSLTYTPNKDYNGTDSFTFKANDGKSDSNIATVTITVKLINDAPIFSAIGNKTIDEDKLLNFTLSAADTDEDILSYSANTVPSGASFDKSTGQFNWTPSRTQAQDYPITFTVSDGKLSASETITITVQDMNRTPSVQDLSVSGDEDVNKAIVLSASDADGDKLTYTVISQPAHGTLSGTAPNLTYTPTKDYNRNDTFTYKVNDGKSDSNIAVVSIAIKPVNDSPVLASIGNKSVDENKLLNFTISAVDSDGDKLDYSASRLPQGAVLDKTTGVFSWTPDFTQEGTYNIIFSVSDQLITASEKITITVANINRPPQIEPIADQAIDEGKVLKFNIQASDPDKDRLVYSISGLPKKATYSYGSFRWIPEYNQAGTYPITFTVSDGVSKAEKTINITVKNISRLYASIDMLKREGYSGRTIKFSGSYSSPSEPDGKITSVLWNFGDKTTSTSLNPGWHDYKLPAYSQWTVYIYTVSLTITDDQGLTATRSRDIYLYPQWMWHNYIRKGRDWDLWFLLAKYYPGKIQTKRIAP